MHEPNVAENLLDGHITTRPPISQSMAPHHGQSPHVLHMSRQKENIFYK